MQVARLRASTLQAVWQRGLRHRGNWAGLPRQFQKAIAKTVSVAWMFTTSEDFRYPETEGKRSFGMGFFHWYSRRLLEAAADNPQLAQSFYLVMHMLKPTTAMFTPRVLAAVLFWKKPRQSTQDEYLARANMLNDVGETEEARESVGAAHH